MGVIVGIHVKCMRAHVIFTCMYMSFTCTCAYTHGHAPTTYPWACLECGQFEDSWRLSKPVVAGPRRVKVLVRPGGVYQVLGDGGGHKESRQGDICRDINVLILIVFV